MDDCLFKPISLESLKKRLDSFEGGDVELPAEQQAPSQSDDIDFSSLDKLVRGDHAALRELLNDLAISNEQDMARLSEEGAGQDWQGLSNLAHKIKGGARIVKARKLIAACEQVEAVCEAKDNEQVLAQAVAGLELEMSKLALSLKQYSLNA